MITNYANKVMDYEYDMFMSLMHVSVSKHLFDEHFTVVWANGYFYELIEYTKEEYESQYHNHVDEYYYDNPQALAAMGKIIVDAYEKQENGYEFESPMRVNGGRIKWIRVTGRFTDEVIDGIPVIYTIYTDITDLKEMQLELEKRTEELNEALLAAEKANRAKSEFLSRMSHDIRTPMNAIVGMTEIAAGHLGDSDKVQDCLKKIDLSSKHLLGLINDVLDMSKIESGKMTINRDIMSLPEILENVVAIVQPGMKAKSQKFSVRLHNVRHEQFMSDALRLRQIFVNILSNAVKFTPTGGSISMEVTEAENEKDGYVQLQFVFSDTGIGMKPQFLKHLFDAFTREQDSRVDKTEGSGLGMAITKKIVEILDGSIDVESREGDGSVFTVSLPMKLAVQPEYDLEKMPELRILVVDDDAIMCEYTMQMLKDLGIQGDWSANGSDALKMMMELKEKGIGYDAVILDWMMPEQDGLETAQMIREKLGEELPILIISAYDWADIETEARTVGVSGFLTKPLFPSTLLRGIQRYVLGQNTEICREEPVYEFSGRRFLLAEDNAMNMEIAVELLSVSGAVVDHVKDGKECVEQFQTSPEGYYDVILMDIQMPVMNGYEATRAIRALPRKDARTVPILAMTADVFQEDVAAAKEAGMNGHLAKPIDIQSIKREIHRFL